MMAPTMKSISMIPLALHYLSSTTKTSHAINPSRNSCRDLKKQKEKTMVKTISLVILSVLLLSSSLGSATATETKQSQEEVQRMYEQWLMENRKNYNALGEKERRFNIFKDNLKLIEAHNSVPDRTYELGLTRFADLTDDEFRAIHLRGKMEVTSDPVIGDRYLYKEGDVLPDKVDWRDEGAVAPVKDQGDCGMTV